MNELPVILDTFSGLMAKVKRAFVDVALEGRPKEQRLLLMVFAGLYGNISASIMLLRNGDFSSLPLVLRPALESYADIVNISNVDGYATRLLYDLDIRQLKFLRGLKDLETTDNRYDSEIEDIIKQIESYEKNDKRTISKREKFELSGLVKYYTSVYGIMSGHTHNDLNFITSKATDTSGSFFDSYASLIRVQKVLPAYLMVICEALFVCTNSLATTIRDHNSSIILSFQNDIDDLKHIIISAYDKKLTPTTPASF